MIYKNKIKGEMEAIKRQASKFREQVAKQQQVFANTHLWFLIILCVFFVKILIWRILAEKGWIFLVPFWFLALILSINCLCSLKDSIFMITILIIGLNFDYRLFCVSGIYILYWIDHVNCMNTKMMYILCIGPIGYVIWHGMRSFDLLFISWNRVLSEGSC